MPEKNARYFLKEKESRALLDKGSARLKADLGKILASKPVVEIVRMDFADVFLVNGRPSFIEAEGKFYPTLIFAEILTVMPKLVVDMGAIPHICKGADVMAPGVREFRGDFCKGDLVVVIDEKHGKAVAVGEALFDSEEAKKANRGMIIKNIHFVGDKAWCRIREFETKVKPNS
jgi:PUA-domain protein